MTKRRLACIGVAEMIAALICVYAISATDVRGQDRSGPPNGKQATPEAEAKELRKARFDEMRRRAESTVVFRLGAEKSPAKLLAEPVLRYSGEFHGIRDATTWVYGDKGRPLAVEKIEWTRTPYLNGYYYCLASLCDGLIAAQWPGEPRWSSTGPGVEMRTLTGAPQPASSEAARMRQMKDIVRRFAATRVDKGTKSEIREENRLLAQPVHRYRDPDSGLLDGAIFAFIASGTNPDFLLLIEVRGADLAQAAWQYGAARMTTGELHLRLDGKEVWSVPFEWRPGRNVYPTYVHFAPR